MSLQSPVQIIAKAAQTPEFLSEVIISYGKTDDEAKKWLTDNGYKIVDQNLNQDAEGGGDVLGWLGIASEKRSVYLGYKTTDKSAEAITDMKIMNMNGGYSYQAYEKVLEEIKKEKEHFLSNMQKALDEYRENYKKGAVKAKVAHDNLNKFLDDDTGKYMGDLLLNTMKTEDEAAWEKDPKNHADMVTILMQGNSTVVSEIMQNLAFASDTADNSWLDRALATQYATKPATDAAEADVPEDDEFNSGEEEEPGAADTSDTVYAQNGFEAMLFEYKAKHGYDDETLAKRLVAEYDDDAKMFASSLVGLKNLLTNYTKSGLSKNATTEEAKAYFASEEHQFESASLWQAALTMYETLSNVTYNGTSLLNYYVTDDYDYLSNEAYLEGYEAEGIPQRALLYPFVASMSDGQRALLEYMAMNRLLTIGLLDETGWKSLDATLQNTAYGVTQLEPCSVYAEVDRDNFKIGNVAVTNVAQGLQASTGESPDNGVLGTGISYMTAGIGVGSLVIGAAGVVIAAKNWSNAAPQLQEAANAGQDLLTGGLEGNMKIDFAFTDLKMNSAKQLEQEVQAGFRFGRQELEYYFPKYGKTKAEMYTAGARAYFTLAGPDGEIRFDQGMLYDEVANTITMADGIVIHSDGSRTVNTEIRDDYLKFMKKINPDFVATGGVTKAAFEEARSEFIKFSNDVYLKFDAEKMNAVFKDTGIDWVAAAQKNNIDGYLNLTEEQIQTISKRLKENGFEDLSKQFEALNVQDNAKAIKDYNSYKALMGVDEAVNNADALENQAEQAMNEGAGSTFWKWFGVGMAIAGVIMATYFVINTYAELKSYYHVDMLPIPKMMVDRGTNIYGEGCYIYYTCVPCNRAAVGMANEKLGDCGDLNGDVMKQWLALYTTKDTRAGNPIPAKFEVKVGTADLPVGNLPLTLFGFGSAVNLVDEDFVYNNKVGGIYLYYPEYTAPALTGSPNSTANEPGTATATGTVTSSGAYVVTGILSAIGGAAVCACIMALLKRKKKETTAA